MAAKVLASVVTASQIACSDILIQETIYKLRYLFALALIYVESGHFCFV